MTSSVSFVQPDVTLRLDVAGVIRRAALSNAMSQEATAGWVGRPWVDTVARGGNAQVRQMLDDARTTGVSSFHHVRQRFPSGLELSVEYTTVRLGGDAGLLAIGRSLEAVAELRSRLVAAQMSMERDYWKLREVETRYRLLFDASTQPVLLVGADDMRIIEANPAAIRALGVASDGDLLPEILAGQRDLFHAMLSRVREQGRAPGIVVHLGADRQPWLVRASLVAAEPTAVFVLQLSLSGPVPAMLDSRQDTAADGRSSVPLEALVARLPDALVVLDGDGTIVQANRAFAELVEHPAEGTIVGQRLDRWVTGDGAKLDGLTGGGEQLGTVGQVGQRVATVRGDSGTETRVSISAAASTGSSPRYVCMLFHRDARSDVGEERVGEMGAATSMSTEKNLLASLTLREIVQETVAAVERKYILATLEQVKGNRTAAAQVLGLSRQSLYMKLDRYALEEATPVGTK